MSGVTWKRVPVDVLPESFTYGEDSKKASSSYWDYVRGPLQTLGGILRNAFYLPRYRKGMEPSLVCDQQLAEKVVQALKNQKMLCSNQISIVREHFSIRDIPVHIQTQMDRTFTIRLFESNSLTQGKRLRIILFCFHGNVEASHQGASSRRWEPLTMQDLQSGPLGVLKALQTSGVQVDSLVTTSLGNVLFDGFKHTAPGIVSDEMIPHTVIINRGLTSVQKVAHHLYSFPFNYLLHGAAKFFQWDANPEEGLLHLLERDSKQIDPPKRHVVMIEALRDHYFSGAGAFGAQMHKKMEGFGASVFRGVFYPHPFHIRSHHALSLDHLTHNTTTQILANSMKCSFPEGEEVSSMLAREIFCLGNEEWHTCFYVGGNDATLDTATTRDMVPLLSAFIAQGQSNKEQLAS